MMGSEETAAPLPTTDVAAPAATTVRELQPPNAALPVDPTSVPNSPPSVPLIQQQETLQLLQAGRWVELASNRNVQQYLQHHCPVCYQWCADAVGLKHHMAHVHSSWLASRAGMQHLLKAFRRAIVLPCRYCKQSRVNKDRHYLQCPVLSIVPTYKSGMTRFTLDQMDLDSEEAKFFGRTDDPETLPPTKRPRPEGESSTYPMTKRKGKGKKGKGARSQLLHQRGTTPMV